MLIFLACILGFIAGAFLLVQIGICLFFAIPTTKKLYSQGLIKNKDEIILRYSLSVLFLSLVYLVILGILFAFATVGFLKAFVFASLATFVIGRLKGPVFYNEANMKEYLKSNAKHFAEKLDEQSVFNLDNTDKKVSLKLSKEDVESLRLKIRSWANSRRGNVDSFFSIFEHLKLKENYKFDYVLDSENSVYPYIRGNTEQKIKDFKDYETINSNYFSDSKDESFFDKDMDKIELDGSAISFYELVVFNYYIKIFFFSPSEYGGKIILNDVDKNGIMNRYEDDNFYTNEEKNVINNLDLSDPVKSRNKVNYVSIVDTDASFEMRKKEYKITKDNHIMLENETTIIPYKILF